MAIEGPGYASPDNIPLQIATTLIGSWDQTVGGGPHLSSRIASASATDNLCHSFQAFNINYQDTGLWFVDFYLSTFFQILWIAFDDYF